MAGEIAGRLHGNRPLGRHGLRVATCGFGTAPLGNLGKQMKDEDAWNTLEAAWDGGVRYFDTAPHYGLGLAEERLGRFLRTKKRDEYVVSTKVGRLLVPSRFGVRADPEGFAVRSSLTRVFDFSADAVRRSLEASLNRIGIDRVDVVFVHDPDNHMAQTISAALPSLENLRSEGLITSYGAGMNDSAKLATLVSQSNLDVVMCAGRYTLSEQPAAADLLPAVESYGVSIVAAGVFNSGLLARAVPSAQTTYDYVQVSDQRLRQAMEIAEVCANHRTTLPVAALHFPLLVDSVATVCVGARTPAQIRENLRAFAEDVDPDLWVELARRGLLNRETSDALFGSQKESPIGDRQG